MLASSKSKSAPNGEKRYCCPFCLLRVGKKDTSFHLYVNKKTVLHGIRGWFICKRCGAKGPTYKLFNGDHEPAASVSEWRDFTRYLRTGKKATQSVSAIENIGLPLDYSPVFKGTRAYDYLRERSISDYEIAYYKIGFGSVDMRNVQRDEQHLYAGSGRIVFPNYTDDGGVNYWVARTYCGHKIRYKNPRNTDAGKVIYNLANAKKYASVVITEGVISAIRSGKNAVATFGKGVTDYQVSMLVSAKFDEYIIALDGDATVEAIQLAKRLFKRGCAVRLVKLPYQHDPASVENFHKYLLGAFPYPSAKFAHLVFK